VILKQYLFLCRVYPFAFARVFGVEAILSSFFG
jgi:hypothetical protein